MYKEHNKYKFYFEKISSKQQYTNISIQPVMIFDFSRRLIDMHTIVLNNGLWFGKNSWSHVSDYNAVEIFVSFSNFRRILDDSIEEIYKDVVKLPDYFYNNLLEAILISWQYYADNNIG